MSQPKFAAITSSLLARKGEARPWSEPVKQPLSWRAAPEPPPDEPRADWKKCTIRMSHHDYERLGILAVKQDKTRQRLLQEAVDRLFTGLDARFDGQCLCLGPSRNETPAPGQAARFVK